MKQNFYLHFETKPSFAELDKLFDFCDGYQPIMSNSYLIAFDTTGKQTSFFDLVRQLFPRCRYAAMQVPKNKFRHYMETCYMPIV